MAQPSSTVPTTTSIATGMIALAAVRVTFGCADVEPGSSFMTPVRLATASTPLSARITPTNCVHAIAKFSCAGSRLAVLKYRPLKAMIAITVNTAGTAR